MKKIFLLLVSIPLLLTSCTKDPIADFTVSNTVVSIGETVYFTNRSIDAERIEWDFGDGFVSNSFHASHYYEFGDDYNVRLKAFNNSRVDIAEMTVSVGASLEITVEEYYEPYYLVSDISVILFRSVVDWDNQTNMVVEGFTNENGVVRFDHLATQRYYVDVYGPNHDNYELRADNVDFIETPLLNPGDLTIFKALVDYYPTVKKSTISRFELKAQRKIEASELTPRVKAERK